MGTLVGHIVPGTFFICFSLWWAIAIFRRYFHSALNPSAPAYKSTATFTSRHADVPVEPLLKLLACIIGIIGEAVTGFDNDWNYSNIMNNLQHIAMFGFYLMNSIADLAIFYKVRYLPPNIDYIFASIAISNEGFLFANHLHGRPKLDTKLHMCLMT